MKTKKTTLISQETHEVLSIRLYRPAQPEREFGWCAECGVDAPLLTPEEAASLAGVSVRDIYRLVEAESIHFEEAPEGRIFVCLNHLHTLEI